MFDCHRSRENDFITSFIYYITLCNRVVKKLCDFVENKLALEPTTQSSFLAIVLVEVEI